MIAREVRLAGWGSPLSGSSRPRPVTIAGAASTVQPTSTARARPSSITRGPSNRGRPHDLPVNATGRLWTCGPDRGHPRVHDRGPDHITNGRAPRARADPDLATRRDQVDLARRRRGQLAPPRRDGDGDTVHARRAAGSRSAYRSLRAGGLQHAVNGGAGGLLIGSPTPVAKSLLRGHLAAADAADVDGDLAPRRILLREAGAGTSARVRAPMQVGISRGPQPGGSTTGLDSNPLTRHSAPRQQPLAISRSVPRARTPCGVSAPVPLSAAARYASPRRDR